MTNFCTARTMLFWGSTDSDLVSTFVIRISSFRHRRLFQSGDVDLVHFHHRVHDALGFRFIGIAEHVAENDRADLPRETEFVFEPAAWPGRSAVSGKFLPEIIDLV